MIKNQVIKALKLTGICTVFVLMSEIVKSQGYKLPNVVYILADDLGYGDLGCYGQEKIQTPNIDALASKGMIFTQHYSGYCVCAPSRSTLLTGQHTGHTPIRKNQGHVVNGVRQEGQIPLPGEVVTVAEIFQQAGYVTGAFGKWGLGYPGSEGDPNNQGFDRFYGYNCQTLSHNYYPYHLWENQNKIILDGNRGKQKGEYAADLIHEEALEFIHQNKNRPFFLYYPNLIPHAELDLPEKYVSSFKGKFLPEKKYRGVDDGPRYKKGGYCSQQEAHAVFAAMVSLLDKQVGEIVEKLKQEGILENTLIIFSSDNGPHQEGGADPDFFNSNDPLKGYKRDLYEGGIRVPMIVSWKGHIEEGAKTDHISAFWDFLPTVCELTGYKMPENIDGISFLPVLTGKGKQKEHKYLYWEFYENDGRMAIRKGDWKLVKYNAFDKDRCKTYLYDLSKDLGETNDLSKEYSKKVTRLEQLMKDAHVDSGI